MAGKKSLTGHLSAFIAYSIFGFNIIVCKDLTSGGERTVKFYAAMRQVDLNVF